jgi:hypothetical protein
MGRYRLVLVLVAILPIGGCLFRSRRVERAPSSVPLKTASQQQLLNYINSQAELLKTVQATVDIDTSVGGVNKGKITDYQQIRGFILARKPAMLRMVGLLPVVRSRAFDMVSDGKQFKLWIPPKNRFIVGRNDEPPSSSQQPLENLRPEEIYQAILLSPVEVNSEIAVMDSDYEFVEASKDHKEHKVPQPDYEILVIRKGEEGYYLARKIVFGRTDLLPHRQFFYGPRGELLTDSRYEDYKSYGGIEFPNQIQIWRPQEEYDIVLTVVKLELNQALPDDKFTLEQPPGAEVVHLGSPPAGSSGPGGTR